MSCCVKCGGDLPAGALFCPFCGKKQIKEPRRHKKRANGTGSITRLSGNRKKPWRAQKNGMLIGTYATRSEAQKSLERLTDIDVTDRFNLTFSQIYEMWRLEHSREITKKLDANYALAFSQCRHLHDQKFRSITRSAFQSSIISLEDSGMSRSTCEKLRTLFTQLSSYALNEGAITVDRSKGLKVTASQKSERQIFSDDDIEKIRASKLPAAKIALILISCGCRPGELFRAPLDRCMDDHIIWGSKTMKGRDRVIPIGPDGSSAYHELLTRARESNSDLLIDGYTGRNHTAENFAKRDWKELMEEIGRPDVPPYSCRHTFVTRSIRSGMDLITLESIVGHVDKETTKLYTHLNANDLVSAVQKAHSSHG